jgi:hypothetical protein
VTTLCTRFFSAENLSAAAVVNDEAAPGSSGDKSRHEA